MKKVFLMLLCLVLTENLLAHGVSETDKQLLVSGGIPDYIFLGAVHMLTGYDHLLFIFGVIFFLSNVRDIIKFITVFTLGHSITLIFATLLQIQVNYYLIDAVIALTVCYKGFENLDGFKKFLNINPNLLIAVFIFGFIHGFGLSTRLQLLPLGNDTVDLIARIIAFNLGVEAGQVIALILMIAIISGWRKSQSFTRFARLSNVSLVIFGAVLFFIQIHGYEHYKNPEEFGFNNDAHLHAHEDMQKEREKLENLSQDLIH